MRKFGNSKYLLGRAIRPALVALGMGTLSGIAMLPVSAQVSHAAWLQVTAEDGVALISVPMPEGAGWCLAWNHSVEGFEVLDCYRNVSDNMVLERSHLPDFAAGLDHVLGRGRQVSDGEDGYWIEDIDEPVPGNRYRLRVGAMRVDHRLVSRGQPMLETLIEHARETCGDSLPASLPAAETPISISELAANQAVTVALVPCAFENIQDGEKIQCCPSQ
ncbi:DUF1850 domain-containing protein [Halomonas huangheensis]|uniref:DUF1850 domain-containing protein n=1 Tax=Halomonas huangheensis TaxID=1178482 RepID=W1N487_9GAMM|nr:DUF1850 domain-containing protein [Halomonas huangheensis]ALM51519.1 hypothetical protein AR456_03840 [Halomonas huangheensis]ERL49986.1 hypothetical protein BJB45_02345 [Halomonas huangheensis]